MIVGQFQSEAQSEQRMQLNRCEERDRFKQLSIICPQILLKGLSEDAAEEKQTLFKLSTNKTKNYI